MKTTDTKPKNCTDTFLGVAIRALCVPSMRPIQKGFKSPVYKMNIEEQEKLLAMKRTTSLSAVALAKEGPTV